MTEALAAPIGLLGGTFDPVHNGHLAVASEVAQKLQLDDMRLMPNPRPAHRQIPLLTPVQRISALKLALANYPALSLELGEWQAGEAGKTTYSVDSLRALRQLYPQRPLVFVMGDDAYADIASWKESECLIQLCHLVVVSRPGFAVVSSGLAAAWLQDLTPTPHCNFHNSLSGSVQHLQIQAVDVSATDIRRCLAAGEFPHGLVPDTIYSILEPVLCPQK